MADDIITDAELAEIEKLDRALRRTADRLDEVGTYGAELEHSKAQDSFRYALLNNSTRLLAALRAARRERDEALNSALIVQGQRDELWAALRETTDKWDRALNERDEALARVKALEALVEPFWGDDDEAKPTPPPPT